MTKPQPRFPVKPLHQIVATLRGRPYCEGLTADGKTCPGCSKELHTGPGAFARYIGFSEAAPPRWLAEGGIPEDSANRAAFAIGLHPCLIPGWCEVIEEAIARDAACGDCSPIDVDDPFIAQTTLFPSEPLAAAAV